MFKIRVTRKVFSTQICFIRCRPQHLQPTEQSRYSRFAFLENTINYSPNILGATFLGSDESQFLGRESFVLLAYASLAASRKLMQWLLACVNLNLDSEDNVGAKENSDFYELTQQHKQMKTMEMSQVWPDIYKENMHQFQSEPTHKIH